ncbi:IPT/TIG domain-containing protein [Kitasatospora sp. NPDC048298]|uniref:IPT/TIG domain-containing protein n=1 Tax=Kitasatospora sp. NPDC048298 TaxID=3364049 RepID=UPI0037115FED
MTPLSPATGEAGSTIAIAGSGFDADCVVGFGTVPRTAFRVESDKRIRATAPVGVGVVDVRITNTLDTSPAGPAGEFTYTG